MRILLTGTEGFVGSHLGELLLQEGHQLFGVVWKRDQIQNIQHLEPHLELFECELRDAQITKAAVARTRPDAVVHLAALSSVAASFKDPAGSLNGNLSGAVNLLEAARALETPPKLLMIGSGEQYGPVPGGRPIPEGTQQRPGNPYAVSKGAQELLAHMYGDTYKLPVYCTRSFNHIGPRQADAFVCSSFARQIAEIEAAGGEGVMKVGNLAAERDFTDVRDVARAYLQILERGRPGETYNVCSEHAISIRSLLDGLLSLTDAQVTVEPDPARQRPSDIPRLLGSAAKLREHTAWSPSIALQQTLQDTLEDWRGRLAA